MAKISVVINTLNEEENIARAIKSVQGLAYEIVVVDMHSEDKTVEIARGMGAKVYTHRRMGYVEPARNFAIARCSGDWVLVLDADEEVSVGLKKKLLEALVAEPDYYAVPRKNIIFGKWIKHSNWWPDRNIRFFRKGFARWSRKIHSVPLTRGKGADISAEEELAIVHHHYVSVSQYVQRHDRYSSIMAKEKFKRGERFTWKSLLAKPIGEFLSRYFSSQGYKDGVHGLVLSSLQAFVELLIYVKLWELSRFPERALSASEVAVEMKNIQKEVNYWVADTLVKESGGLMNRIKRKFRLR